MRLELLFRLTMIELTEIDEIIECLIIEYYKALYVTENSVTNDYWEDFSLTSDMHRPCLYCMNTPCSDFMDRHYRVQVGKDTCLIMIIFILLITISNAVHDAFIACNAWLSKYSFNC